ncbi:MAG: LytTR family DNA-binding domain-containing protein [Oscillospiraceae bacterium]
MKIRIEIDEGVEEDEVIIRCRELTNDIQKIQNSILEHSSQTNLIFYKNLTEYFLPMNSVLFFETSEKGIDAHTPDDVYQIKNKLYELEEILPNHFVRVSKSTILNVNHIYSIEKNITSASVVQFNRTHKQVYVSRNYYKILKQKLHERRNYYEA